MVDFLVCRPEYFDVSYEINPWMRPDEWSDNHYSIAQKEHIKYEIELQKLGAELYYLPPVPNLPDLVFTANGGVLLNKKVLISKFKYPQRQPEEVYFEAIFNIWKNDGLVTDVIHSPVTFEGAGDCLWDPFRKLFWMGYSQRSSYEARYIIEDYFGVEVIPLELATPKFYHLDTAFCPLQNGEIIFHPDAFTLDSLSTITNNVDDRNFIIPSDSEDHDSLSMNAVNIDNNIIFSKCSTSLEYMLYEVGYNVIRSPLTSFLRSGGGPKCLVLKMDDEYN